MPYGDSNTAVGLWLVPHPTTAIETMLALFKLFKQDTWPELDCQPDTRNQRGRGIKKILWGTNKNLVTIFTALMKRAQADSCAIYRMAGSDFIEKNRGNEVAPQWLLPIWPLQYSITVILNLRMTDAANQRQVREVKLRSIHWPFPWPPPFREPIIRAINGD